MNTIVQDLTALIKEHLKDAQVEIIDMTGTWDHLEIQVTSDAFLGKRLIEKHQMIMDILKERLKEDLHAVKLKTLTYQEANNE